MAHEFEYGDLSRGEAFRLFKLHPAKSDTEEVRIDISTESLTNAPEYGAISYTWDEQGFDKEITANDKKFRVTQNCWDILILLRQKDKPRYLWIDQICINQASLDDRAHNVKRMAKIYAKAAEVFVWAGHLDDQTLDLLVRLAHLGSTANTTESLIEQYKPEYVDRQIWTSFCARPWFQRMWTLQETSTARQKGIFLLTSQQQIPFSHIFAMSHKIISTVSLPMVQSSTLGQDLDPTSSTQTYFSDMVVIALSRACSEPRDKIFALYSILEKAWNKRRPQETFDFPEPDYSKKVAEIYIEAVAWAFSKEWDLRNLYCAPVTQTEITERLASPNPNTVADELPSWVPDFHWLATLDRKIPNTGFFFAEKEYGVVRSASAPYVTFDPPLLYIQGRMDDVVKEVGIEMHNFPHPSNMKSEDVTDAIAILVNGLEDWFMRMEVSIPPDNANRSEDIVYDTLLNDVGSGSLQGIDQTLRWCVQYFKEQAKYTLGNPTKESLMYELIDTFYIFYKSEPPMVRNSRTFTQCAQLEFNKQDGFFATLITVLWELGSQSLVITEQHRIGVSFGAVKPGDIISRISGLGRPAILRKKGPRFTLVGFVHMPSLMHEGPLPLDPSLLEEIVLE